MSKLVRIYNQNRGLCLAIISVIALIIIIIQTLNSLLVEKSEAKENNLVNEGNSSTYESTTISPSNVSSVTGQNVRNSESNEKTIKQFVKYCNEGDINSAYNMLTDDCKNKIYPSLERFKIGYIDRIFYMNRMYTLENWYSYSDFSTYYIKYTEDVLATGNVSSENNIGDYITVVRGETENKINVNSFVGSEELNRQVTKSKITITAYKIYYYMDYTIVEFKVKNNTNGIILLDTKKNLDTTYLYDTNGVKYTSFLNEKAEEDLKILRSMERSVEIKFNKIYNPENRTIRRSFV